jgi:hypothetical protein
MEYRRARSALNRITWKCASWPHPNTHDLTGVTPESINSKTALADGAVQFGTDFAKRTADATGQRGHRSD